MQTIFKTCTTQRVITSIHFFQSDFSVMIKENRWFPLFTFIIHLQEVVIYKIIRTSFYRVQIQINRYFNFNNYGLDCRYISGDTKIKEFESNNNQIRNHQGLLQSAPRSPGRRRPFTGLPRPLRHVRVPRLRPRLQVALRQVLSPHVAFVDSVKSRPSRDWPKQKSVCL